MRNLTYDEANRSAADPHYHEPRQNVDNILGNSQFTAVQNLTERINTLTKAGNHRNVYLR